MTSQNTVKKLQPGFQINFDNLNMLRRARHKTLSNANQHYDMVQAIAVQDRVNVESLDDMDRQTKFEDADPNRWKLSQEEEETLQNTLITLVTRILCQQMKFFKDHFQHLVIMHIPHPFQEQTKLKSKIIPLGIMRKNEMLTDDMITILEHFQGYCPRVNGQMKKILCGGDGLTAKRGADAQKARADASNQEDRLEGLIMKSEDWHEAVLCMQMTFNDLYAASSVAEKGTLYQLKERFDRRNVRKDVKQEVHACREFLRFVTYGYVVLAAIKILGIDNKDAVPPGITEGADDATKQNYMHDLAKRIVRNFVLRHEEDGTRHDVAGKKKIPCAFYGCNESFQLNGLNRELHMASCPYREESAEQRDQEQLVLEDDVSNKDSDKKYTYSCKVLREGLMDMARVDASNEGDGKRSYIMWKYDFINFASTRHTVYAELAFTFISQVEFLLSERKAAQLLHNRTVNLHGGEGRNVPIDYAIELLNGEVKPDLKHRFGNLTEKVIARAGQSLKGCKDIATNIEIQLEKLSAIGRHKEIFFEEDVSLMAKELQKDNLFDRVPGRTHKTFTNIKPTGIVNWDKISKWIKQKRDKIAKAQKITQLMNAKM